MKNELESRLVLSVFDKIRQHGDVKDDKQFDKVYFLEGVSAATDFDGYTLYLKDASVNLSFGFHNKYHFDSESHEQVEQFEKKLRYIDTNY
jgi:hypothetical protein